MRLIDADAITYELWTTEVDSNRDNYRYFQNRYMVDRRDIESMPTIQQWIPCSERLPDKVDRYLVTNSEWGSYEVSWNVWLTNSGQWLYNGNPIAWMPLPKPYRGDNHE